VHLPVSSHNGPLSWSINGKVLDTEQREVFAKADGFEDCYDMAEWILETHGQDFTGTLIAWEWRNYLPALHDGPRSSALLM